MAHKSATQPLCRWCGKPIAKHTNQVYFGRDDERRGRPVMPSWSYRAEKPASREDAQRLVNQQIVAVSWWARDVWDGEKEKYTRRREYIDRVSTWDGESYEDPFFCNGDHARRFGYAAARKGLAMPAYNEAMKPRGP